MNSEKMPVMENSTIMKTRGVASRCRRTRTRYATTALIGTTLTVPFPTTATTLTPNLPGLSAGAVQAQVWQQTGTNSFTLFGSAALTVTGP
jgi:hypothetical protein